MNLISNNLNTAVNQLVILRTNLTKYGLNPKEWILLRGQKLNTFYIVNLFDSEFMLVGKITSDSSYQWSEVSLFNI